MIYHGDALTVLRTFADQTINCCVTSPPYWGLRDYGTAKWRGGTRQCNHVVNSQSAAMKQKRSTLGPNRDGLSPTNAYFQGVGEVYRVVCRKCGARRIDQQLGLESTPEEYVTKLVEIFREVKRVLRDDGTLWLNLGDCYATGGGKVGNCPGGGAQGERWAGRGMNTKQPKWAKALGPICQPNRMPLEGLKPKDLVGIPWRVAFALQADGWYLRSDIVWAKPNPMPESVTDRPTKAHEYLFLLAKSEQYYYDKDAIAEPAVSDHSSGNKHRKVADGSETRPNTHLGRSVPWVSVSRKALHGPTYSRHRSAIEGGQSLQAHPNGVRNRRTVWTITTKPYKGAHFATFPPKLIEPCVLAGCPEGGTVLDCFAGAGTTLLVAQQHGRSGIGIELNRDYIKLAESRLRDRKQLTMAA